MKQVVQKTRSSLIKNYVFANNDVTMQWLPLSEKFVHKASRPLSRRLDRCDRVIQDEVGDSNGGNV